MVSGLQLQVIGEAPINDYAVTHMRNKNSNIQGRSPNVVKVIFHTTETALKGNNKLPLGANLKGKN